MKYTICLHLTIFSIESNSSPKIHKMNKEKDKYGGSLTCSDISCILFCVFFLLCRRACGVHYQYEACVPRSCGVGPSISFPFYIPGLQESYCGYPGFTFNCSSQFNGFPVLHFPENDYVVEDIFYQNRSLHVYNTALSGLNSSSTCVPTIRNTTLLPMFNYFNTRKLHLFSNCSSVSTSTRPLSAEGLFGCDGSWDVALYDGDENLRNASLNCVSSVVAPVDESNGVGGDLLEELSRGFMLRWTVSDCSTCEDSGGRCGFNETNFHFRCFCPDRPHSRSCGPRRSNLPVPLITGLAVASIVTALLMALIFILKKRRNKSRNQKDIELFLKKHENLAPKRFKYRKLKKITNSFNECLGKGGYGKVYKGKLEDGRLVAAKILNGSKENGEDFMNEVASISRTSHVNIVSLLGFCFEGSKRALIYEYMPNGSLEKFINQNASSSKENKIGWEKLFEIAVGIARGLDYLHQGCNTRILHLDIKPHNVLLDEDLKPKIADFGLAKLCPNRASIVSMVVARGTIGYISPEVFCRNFGDVSYKSDVYSYGMMVLEMVGKRNNSRGLDGTSEVYFPQNIYRDLEIDVKNRGLQGSASEDESQYAKRNLTIVGLWCIQTNPKDRPSMSRVVDMLEGKLEPLQVPPMPQSCTSEPYGLASEFSTSE